MKTEKTLTYFINKYINKHPLFFAFIRPQEALLFQKNIKLIKSPALDFGSGDGFFADLVFEPKQIDVGLDLQNNRTLEGEKARSYQKVIYYDGNIIPYKDNTYNTVVSNCVLEHIPDIDQSLKEIRRILKPGGHFITTVMADKWNQYQLGAKLFGSTYNRYMKKRQVHFNLFSDKEWRAHFKSAGFTVEQEIGYLSAHTSHYLDFAHYLSIPSLITRMLFRKWVLFPQINSLINTAKFVEKYIELPVPADKSAAIFYVLKN
jgi:ubiquinone/menaquinone biosynthesis C-methylase UbiE